MMRKFLALFVLSGVCFVGAPRAALAAGCDSVFYDEEMVQQYYSMEQDAFGDGDVIGASEFLLMMIYYQNQIYSGATCIAADPSENPDVTDEIASMGD
jgi:hypothetical protein